MYLSYFGPGGKWSCLHPDEDLLKQPLGLHFEGADVGLDLGQRPQQPRLVEMPREADLVANLLRAGSDLILLAAGRRTRSAIRQMKLTI